MKESENEKVIQSSEKEDKVIEDEKERQDSILKEDELRKQIKELWTTKKPMMIAILLALIVFTGLALASAFYMHLRKQQFVNVPQHIEREYFEHYRKFGQK